MKFLSSLLFVCILFCASCVNAQVTTIQAMDFGNFISRNNNFQFAITLNPDGTFSFDSAGFFVISAPQQGIYDIFTSQVNATIVSVDVQQSEPLTAPGGAFTLSNFQAVHSGITDGAGIARVMIGATARTTGTGLPYPDQTYDGSIDIEVNF